MRSSKAHLLGAVVILAGGVAAGAYRIETGAATSGRALVVLAAPLVAVAVAACVIGVIALQLRERRTAEARVRVVEASAAALFTSLPDGVVVLHGHEVVAVNNRLCELLGCTTGAVVGSSWAGPFAAPEHRHELHRWLAELAEHGSAEATLVLCDTGGRRLTVEASGRAISTPGTPEERHVVTIRDVSRSLRTVERLSEVATCDPVTGLLNSRGFHERLREEVRRARTSAGSVGLVLLELTSSGLGERALITTAQLLLRHVRVGEYLGRTREREIAWILPDTDAAGAATAVERFRVALTRVPGFEADRLRVAAGVCDLAHADDAGLLYALASQALDRARRQDGEATICFRWPAAVVHGERLTARRKACTEPE